MIKVEQLDLETLSKMYVNLNSYTRNNIIEKLKNLNAIEVQKLGLDADFIYNELGFGTFVEEKISEKLIEINNRIDELLNMIRNLETSINNRMNSIISSVTNLDRRVTTETSNIYQRINEIDSSVNIRLDLFGDSINEFREYLNSFDLEGIRTEIEELRVAISNNSTNIMNLNTLLNNLSTTVNEINNNMTIIVRQSVTPSGTAAYLNRIIWVDTSVSPNIVRIYVNNKWTGMNTYA